MFLAPSRALRLLSQAKFQQTLCHPGTALIHRKPGSSAFNLNKTAGQRATNATSAAEESIVHAAGTTADETTDALRQENKLLRSELAGLRWPELRSFLVGGRQYPLPWHPPMQSSVKWSKSDLQYLSGVFDGDGCAASSSCKLSMTQSYDHPELLLLFQNAFGGGIYNMKNSGIGLTKPSLQWQLVGAKAKQAARELSAHSCTKRRQLELIASWPKERSKQIDSDLKLRFLKTHDSATKFHCSWSYCAGFLDADGCITLSRRGAVLVRFCQKFPSVLEHIRNFMAEQVGVTAKIYRCGKGFELRISSCFASKLVLKHMLDSGLCRKAMQASLAVNSTPESVVHIRDAFARSVGNQQFGKRLDEDGASRFMRINNLQMRLRYWKQKGQNERAVAVLKEIQVLQSQHAFLKAQSENRQLHQYRRMVQDLRTNGWWMPVCYGKH